MAEREHLEYNYTLLDRIFRFCIGETGDYSGALYNGDFSLTLEQAQRQKHEYIYNNLNIQAGSQVLDIGCGWGPFLSFLREKGVKGVGVTLSTGQAQACTRNGLDVHILNCRTITPETFGTFDAVSCIDVFEAFCSKEEWKAGKQDEIYHNFFKVVYDLLPNGGRFYMQTALFGKNRIDPERMDIDADKDSDAYIAAAMEREFPGHWLAIDVEQIIGNAKPYFKLISKSNGRLDYIETIKQWRKKYRSFSFRKYLLYLGLVPKYLSDKDFRNRLRVFGICANRLCFEREMMDHYRLVFEKV